MKNFKGWFTLIEIMLWILIFSMVILWWFYALNAIWIWKIKLIQTVDITKDAYYFTEKFFQEIKSWWTIDFEEYFNRKIVWNTTQSWHYSIPTWFWNFWKWGKILNVSSSSDYWNWFYYCRSLNWVNMWTWWCFNNTWTDFSSTASWVSFNALLSEPQRYWQYAFQFIDYNSNLSSDLWDENGNWNIRWDDDDESLWLWPTVFDIWNPIPEIYLISWDWKTRTLFRWKVWYDKNHPKYNAWTHSNPDCNISTLTWSWCLWTIEFLKLEWKDWWINHTKSWIWAYDWIIDTWIISPKFTWWTDVIAWSNNVNYWQPLFPEDINVKSFKAYLYPNIDVKNAWKDSSNSSNINPYLRINITVTPSWKKLAQIKWKIPEINLTTNVNLSNYFY